MCSLFFIGGCISSTNSTSRYKELIAPVKAIKLKESTPFMIDGQIEPVFPDENENNLRIGGIDSNNNGVRDDLEIYINRRAKSRNDRLALKQFAKYSRMELELWNKVSVDELYKINSNIAKSGECYLYVSKNPNAIYLLSEVTDLIYGNLEREEASKAIGFKLRGYALGSGISANESFKGCEFKVDNLEEVVKLHQPK